METSPENSLSWQNHFSQSKLYFAYFARLAWPGSFLANASENCKQNLSCFPRLIRSNHWPILYHLRKFWYYNQSLWGIKSLLSHRINSFITIYPLVCSWFANCLFWYGHNKLLLITASVIHWFYILFLNFWQQRWRQTPASSPGASSRMRAQKPPCMDCYSS